MPYIFMCMYVKTAETLIYPADPWDILLQCGAEVWLEVDWPLRKGFQSGEGLVCDLWLSLSLVYPESENTSMFP